LYTFLVDCPALESEIRRGGSGEAGCETRKVIGAEIAKEAEK